MIESGTHDLLDHRSLQLSFAQQRLWFLSQIEGVSQAYHIPFAMKLHGSLDKLALTRALDRIIFRHEILRTTFPFIDGQPLQCPLSQESASFPLLRYDISEFSDSAGELSRLTREGVSEPFDLASDLPIRGRLIRVTRDEHVLLIVIHHIAFDGWSKPILLNELSTLYDAYLRGEPDPLPTMEIQYADYSVWQRNLFNEERLSSQREYWKNALAGAPTLLALPTDRPRPPKQDFTGDFTAFEIDEILTGQLKDLSRRSHVTLYMTLLGAWGALLTRLSGQNDLVIGTHSANRGTVQSEQLIGLFAGTLGIRLDLSNVTQTAELLEQTKKQVLGAIRNQELPFDMVVEAVQPPRSLSHSPLFQVMFAWQTMPISSFDLANLKITEISEFSLTAAKFDLTLFLEDTGKTIRGGIEFATSLFNRATIDRYWEHFLHFLRGMVADESRTIATIPILTDVEKHRLTQEWNDTLVDFQTDSLIHELFEQQADRTPNAPAILFEGLELTYEELNVRANQLAHYLRDLGVRSDMHVAICLERSPDMMVALLAVLKAGGAYIPLDPSYPLERLLFMLEDSNPIVLITTNHLRGLFAQNDRLIAEIDALIPPWLVSPDWNPVRQEGGSSSEALAYVIYTSGSTGWPKGVMIKHGALCNYIKWALDVYAPKNGSIVSSSLSFDATLTSLWLPLVYGSPIKLLREGREIDSLCTIVRSHDNLPILKLTPAHLESLIDELSSLDKKASASVGSIVIGGDVLQPHTIKSWQAIFPRIELINEYGPTETVVGCITYKVPHSLSFGPSIPIGKPIANTQIYILDTYGQPVPIGVSGEIHIGGAGVARGYLNRPELTAERFIPNPFVRESDARMYRTGDLGRWLPDGNIEFLGRNDFQVKIRGFRIELGEIEARLAEVVGVRDAIVIAREDTPGDKRLVAYYTSSPGADLRVEQIRAHLSAILPEYMVPAAFVALESIPLTPNGKLDRKALPSPEIDAYATAGYEEPVGEIENALAQIWAEALKVERVGRNDNFFDLGGHSLLAIRVVVRIRQALMLDVAFQDLFLYPSVGVLARHMEKSVVSELPPILPADRQGSLPLSFAQQRLWFLSQIEGVSQAYHIPFAMKLHGSLDKLALTRALDRIIFRHEILRTTFPFIDGQPLQCPLSQESASFPLLRYDISEFSDSAGELSRLTREGVSEPFDLASDLPIRGRLIRVTRDEHVLLIVIHHIAFDGWSKPILLNELSTLYDAYLRGEPDPLPTMEIQYADYSVWQRNLFNEERLSSQREYWKNALAGAPTLLALPTDRPRPPKQDFTGDFTAFEIDGILTGQLKDLSRGCNASLYLTLLGAWGVLLARLSGQNDLVIGTSAAGRWYPDVESLIGFFVNTFALRLKLDKTCTSTNVLTQIRDQFFQAQQHQDIPFEQVVELAQPQRTLSHNPLTQVMFLWDSEGDVGLQLPGLIIEPHTSLSYHSAKFDLIISLHEKNGAINGGIEYATSLFDRTTIDRYLGYFLNLLRGMVADEAQAIDRIPILTESEYKRLTREWNDTSVDFQTDSCVHELFEQQANRTPNAPAILFEGVEITYEELNMRANQLAHYLCDLGVRSNARVAICLEPSPDMIVALLATLKAGGAYVPMDPSYPSDRLLFMLEDSNPVVLITQQTLLHNFQEQGYSFHLICLDNVLLKSHHSAQNLQRSAIKVDAADLAYIIYTSGSTGNPKGVMISHRCVVNTFAHINGHILHTGVQSGLLLSSISFDLSVYDIFGMFATGGRLSLPARDTSINDSEAIARILLNDSITVWNSVPALLSMFVRFSSALPYVSFPSIKTVLLSGDWIPCSLPVQVRKIFPNASIYSLGGATEVSIWSVSFSIHPAAEFTVSIPYGRPLINQQLYILDTYGQPVPIGVSGEIHIGGAGVARGYLNRPELTAERFIPNPFVRESDARMYRTGDLGRWLPDGNIEFLGRNDFQVKIRGFRIELGEIEARLAEVVGVRDAIVIAREDTPGDKRLVAYYTSSHGADLRVEQIRAHLSAILPEYMVPAAFVALESIPLTPNGKLDRKLLPSPEIDAYATAGYEEPVGEIENALAQIWADILKVERVGRNDNFFDLGGHSLLAVNLVERIRGIDLHIDIRSIFIARTLAELATAAKSNVPRTLIPPNRIPADAREVTPEMLPLVDLSTDEIATIAGQVRGGAANIQDIYPLAPLQEGILFHHLMSEDGDPYLLVNLLSFDSRTRLDSYTAAMQAVVDRHDILRTAIIWDELTEPVQVVLKQAALRVEEVHLDPAFGDIGTQLRSRFGPRHYRIDISLAPLIELHIAEDSANGRWLLLLLLHHLAGDHTTLEVMQEEIQAYLLGKGNDLPMPVPFRNFIAQSRHGLSTEDHEIFFRKMLGDIDEPTAPFGLTDVRGDGTEISQERLMLDQGLSQRIRQQARRLGVSAATLCHVAWAQVLARTSARQEVVFGTVLFGRMHGEAGAGRAMGLFINTLPIRISVGQDSAETTVRNTHRQVAALLQHEHATLALAQRCSAVPAPAPLFSSLLNYRYAPDAAQRSSPEAVQAWQGIDWLYGEERTNYPVTLSVDDWGSDFTLTEQVDSSIAPLRMCEFMRTALESLVDALEHEPLRPLSSLEVLPATERRQVLEQWNDTTVSFPDDECIHELFEQQVARTPAATALVFQDVSISYEELNRRANRLAHHLRGLGVVPDSRVALCVERGPEMIVALLAVLKAGGAYVPLDPTYPAERLLYMLEDSSPAALITQSHLRDLLPQQLAFPVLDLDTPEPAWHSASESNPDPTSIGLTPLHLAYIIYTSGSTGNPKGVMVAHQNVARLFSATTETFHFNNQDSWTLFHSYAFDFSVWEIWGALLHGATLVIVPQEVTRSPEDFLDLLRHHKITVLNQTPSAFRQIISAQSNSGLSHHLRYVIFGGEAFDPSLIRPWYANEQNNTVQLFNMYGITETTVHVTCYALKKSDSHPYIGSPIGTPLGDLQIYILDTHGQPVPIGVSGEIHIGGAGVARGYLNRPELTAERFIPNPFVRESDARMYRTGDLGRWLPDGNIEFLGRNDFQVKVRGFRIELGEIEARLAEVVGVRDAIVIAREDTPGDKRLVAYYTSSHGADLRVEQIRAHLSAILPEYMVPAAFVALESIPLTPNGKLDRKALPSPEIDAYATAGYEEPVGEIENALAQIWADILKVERVGRNDNFFDLGGHSLLAISLIERMRRINLHIDVRSIFAAKTLVELATAAKSNVPRTLIPPNRIPADAREVTPEMLPLVDLSTDEIATIAGQVRGGAANIQDIYPLAPLQEGILFHHLMSEDGDPYLLVNLLSFDSRTRLDSYTAAMQAVVDRHDILRTAIIWDELTEPVQVVLKQAALRVEEVHLDPAFGDIGTQLRSRFSPRHYRLDISLAPLIELHIAEDSANGRWLLLLLLHHLIDDNTSFKRMQEEIQAYLLGKGNDLPMPVPFRNFIAQSRHGLSTEDHEIFFRKMLGDIDEPTAPFGLTDVRGDGTEISQERLMLDQGLSQRIRQQARRLGVSAATLCHVAWAQVLARTSARQEVVFGTVLFGRMHGEAGAGRAMGLFINTLPIRISVGQDSAETTVRNTHRQVAALLQHEHATLALAQRCSAVPAPAPLFSSLLNYRYAPDAAQRSSPEAVQAWQGIDWLYGEERTNYPVTLSVDDWGSDFTLTEQVDSSIAPLRMCEFMRTALESLVDALEHEPLRPLSSLEVLPATERRQVLEQWNDTTVSFPDDECIHELFEQQVARTPAATALVFQDVSISYEELNRRANRLAHHLRGLGVVPDSRVALCVERGPEMIVALLAVLKAGGAYVPLDPTYPAERLLYMLEDSSPAALITQSHLRDLLPQLAFPVLDLDTPEPAWHSASESNPDPTSIKLTPLHLAYIIYTSGSTGNPKGVMVAHQNVANLIYWSRKPFPYISVKSTLFSTSLNFDLASFELYVPLTIGAAVIIATNATEITKSQNITLINTVPSAIQHLLESKRVPPSITTINLAGEPLREGLIRQIFQSTTIDRLCNLYGPSETTTYSTWTEFDRTTSILVHIGKPIANTQIYILDTHGQPVPIGVSGEIHIGGAGVARGYLNRPELTAERFIPNPFVRESDARMYRTGDLGRWLPDGNIEFLGRNDFQVKIRGFRIELGEIEARLAEVVGVRDAIVIAREDTPGDKRLVAYYTSSPGADLRVEQIRAHLSAILPEYMVPAAFVALESIPLTPNGKLDRKALPSPEIDAYATAGYEEPVGEIENALAQIWADILKVERVGRNDNFFDLGGHSLLAISLIERMRRINLHIDVRSIFAAKTLVELATAAKSNVPRTLIPPNRIPADAREVTPEMLPLVDLSTDEIATIAGQVRGGAANIQDIYPLAPLQEGILFHHLMSEDGDPYLLVNLLSFDSRTRLDSYTAAMQAVVDRHDILRTAIIWDELTEPVQVVLKQAALRVEEVHLDPAFGDIGTQLRSRFGPRHYRIDISLAPLIELHIAEDSANGRWLLLLLLHHLAGDHTTLEVMQEEIQAYLLGKGNDLPMPVPFRNFIAQSRHGLSTEDHEIFFRKMLGDIDEPTAPFGLTDVRGDGTEISQERLMLDQGLSQRIRQQARRLGVSAATLCHVAWAQVLARTSARQEVVFGTVLFGRMHGEAGAGRAMGLFINTLPIRISVGQDSAETTVRNTHRQVAALLQHEHATLALAQRCSAVPAPAPLFSSLLNYRYAPDAAQRSSPEAVQAWQGIDWLYGEERTNYPVTLSVDDWGSDFTLTEQVDSSIAPLRMCEFMRTALESLVDALEHEPLRPLSSLEVLPATERRQVLEQWNDTTVSFPDDECIHELFEQQVARTPAATALVFQDVSISYEELNRRANRLAHHLRGLGVVPDSRVALCVERGPEMIVALLAVLKAGGAYVPLDPTYPAERLLYMLEDSSPAALITQSHLRDLLPQQLAFPVLDLDTPEPAWHSASESNPDPTSIKLTPLHLAYIIYTSGSTGNPKGVMVAHQNVANLIYWSRKPFPYISVKSTLFSTSLNFDLASFELYVPLTIGAAVIIATNATEITKSQNITLINTVPSAIQHLLESKRVPPSITTINLAGEPLREGLIRQIFQSTTIDRLCNLYGPSETTTYSTWTEFDRTTSILVHIGKPIANTQIYILDTHGQPVPIGVSGEIHIGGAGVARGYLNRPELTAERFIPNPFVRESDARMYRTGDLGRWLPDGNIEFLGRNDFQVKIRGFRIELGEIEARLAEVVGVRDAIVIAREDTPGDKRLVAYYTSSPGADLRVEQIRAHLSAILPEYMVPAAFVALESIPLTPNGKLDRKSLPSPEIDAYATAGYEEPVGEIENALAQIWADILKVERVGRNDNFFDLGGHSLLAISLIERMRRINLHIDVRSIFAAKTLVELATAAKSNVLHTLIPPNRIPATFVPQQIKPLSSI